jgi:putative colanic acid biosynthesis UDP-glucose lipid carrier transferase
MLAPSMTLISLLVRLTSPGPALVRVRRARDDGRSLQVFVFRTRSEDSTHPTPFGWFLERTGLDLLPALIHVVQGHMSLRDLKEFSRSR